MRWLADRLCSLMPGAPPLRLAQLAARARGIDLAKGQRLLAPGERWAHWWFVESGALRLYYLDRDGAEANKNFFLEGQSLWPVTGELRGEPAAFFVEALEQARVHALAMDDVEALLGDAADWTALRLQVLQLLLQDKLWREQLFLQQDAAGRYRELRASRPQWCARIPLRHQASWLGITDVSLSRLRAALNMG